MTKPVIYSVLILFFACRTTKSLVYTSDFIFNNETDSVFHVKAFFRKSLSREFICPKRNAITFTEKSEHVAMNPGEFFNADSIELSLESGRKLIYSWYRKSPTSKYIGNYTGYSESIKDDQHYVYTYNFTQEHIDSAR